MNKRTMQEVVVEFNKLSGQNIKRFATVEIGEKRIAAFTKGHEAKSVVSVKKPAAKVKVKEQNEVRKMASMTVDGVFYRSIKTAFDALGLPQNKHGKFRLKLKASGKEIFEHNGKKHVFIIEGV